MTDLGVSVVVPIWGPPDLTDTCLRALCETAPTAQIIVVDNTGIYQLPVGVTVTKFLRQETNIGCGAAKSLGASFAETPFVVFIDCDAYPHEGWLEPLVAVFDNETVGMAGPRILNRDGSLQTACITVFHGGGSAGGANRQDEHLANIDELGATGACMMVRRTALLECPIDYERFNVSYEDVDLSLQFKEAGWNIAYVPQAIVTHGSTSTGPERWHRIGDVVSNMNIKWGNR